MIAMVLTYLRNIQSLSLAQETVFEDSRNIQLDMRSYVENDSSYVGAMTTCINWRVFFHIMISGEVFETLILQQLLSIRHEWMGRIDSSVKDGNFDLTDVLVLTGFSEQRMNEIFEALEPSSSCMFDVGCAMIS
jgi:hypothetical protein